MTGRGLRACRSALVALVLCVASASAQDEFVLEGNRLYQENDFAGALAAYLRVAESGLEAAALHYNIGNAYFKTGDLGRAILHYERAEVLEPGNADVADNLALARSLTVDEIEPLPEFWVFGLWNRWVDLLPRTALLWVVGLAWLGFGCAWTWVILARGDAGRVLGKRLALVFGGVVLVFGLNLTIRELGIGRPVEAIVLAAETDAQSAPSDDPNLTLFSVHEGTKVRIDRQADGWAEIVLLDGRVGWIRLQDVEVI